MRVAVPAIPPELRRRYGRPAIGGGDPMLRSRAAVAVEPRRIVVELTADEFEALDRASGHLGPAVFLRLVALGLGGMEEQAG